MKLGTDPAVRALARAFARELTAMLGAGTIAEVARRNRAETDPGVCHSHDFCDANEAMLEAYRRVFGRPVVWTSGADPGAAVTDTLNRAWDLAKTAGFDASKVGGSS